MNVVIKMASQSVVDSHDLWFLRLFYSLNDMLIMF